MRVSAACWFDAAWAIIVDAPIDQLRKAHDRIVLEQNRLRPDRETWGLTEDEQAMTARAMNADTAAVTPPRRKRGDGRMV